jgi:hypothetical protein
VTKPVILGRQPVTCYITPSKPNPWYGTIVGGVVARVAVSGGEQFTAEQSHALSERGLDAGEVETITVTRNATTRELYWPSSGRAPQFQFDCPVICRRKDRVQIISPSGMIEWVDASGFAGRSNGGEK